MKSLKKSQRVADNLFMGILLVFFIIFPNCVKANTMLETGTAMGIANTVQGKAQTKVQALVDKARENTQEYENAQKKQIKAMNGQVPGEPQAINSPISDPPIYAPPETSTSQAKEKALEGLSLSTEEMERVQRLESAKLKKEVILPDSDSLENISSEKLKKQFQDQVLTIETKPVDYKAKLQVFYKKECSSSQTGCYPKDPVLTNIRSVIFDYAHTRGSFSKLK